MLARPFGAQPGLPVALCWHTHRFKTRRTAPLEISMLIASVLVGLVALLHIYFLVLEMFFWDTPKGRKVFNTTPEFSAASKTLAANQGLYNGFLAAGLIWSLLLGAGGRHVALFFLGCVVVAGVYGAATASRKILYVQALPAALAIAAVLFLS
jgi:putative membrane protein